MRNRREALDFLLARFEAAMRHLNEGRKRRCAAPPHGGLRRGTSARGSPLLRQLARGEISLDEFLGEKVERALKPLTPHLDPDDIAFLRTTALDWFRRDAVLVALVNRIVTLTTTGASRPAHHANTGSPMTNDAPENSPPSEGEEKDRREARRDAAEVLKTALTEFMRASGEEPPELVTAIEYLAAEAQRLNR